LRSRSALSGSSALQFLAPLCEDIDGDGGGGREGAGEDNRMMK